MYNCFSFFFTIKTTVPVYIYVYILCLHIETHDPIPDMQPNASRGWPLKVYVADYLTRVTNAFVDIKSQVKTHVVSASILKLTYHCDRLVRQTKRPCTP